MVPFIVVKPTGMLVHNICGNGVSGIYHTNQCDLIKNTGVTLTRRHGRGSCQRWSAKLKCLKDGYEEYIHDQQCPGPRLQIIFEPSQCV
jgi:hypothetical protein